MAIPLNSGRAWEVDPAGAPVQDPQGITGSTFVRDSNDHSVRAVIKTVTDPARRYALGMERVGYRLAVELGLPVSTTYLETYNGAPASVQIRIAGRSYRTAGGLPMMMSNIVNANLWPRVVTFDIWMANTDRHAGNIYLEPIPATAAPQRATGSTSWLIDHGQAGLWPGWKLSGDAADTDNIPDDPASVATGECHPNVERHLQNVMCDALCNAFTSASAAERTAAIDAIRQVSDHAITDAVNEVPMDYFTPNQAATLRAFLQARRTTVDTVVSRYW